MFSAYHALYKLIADLINLINYTNYLLYHNSYQVRWYNKLFSTQK